MHHLSLTAVDYAALGIIFDLGVCLQTFRGLVHETFAIIDWLVAGYAALRLTPIVVPFTEHFISSFWLQWIVAGVGDFSAGFHSAFSCDSAHCPHRAKIAIGAADRVWDLFLEQDAGS